MLTSYEVEKALRLRPQGFEYVSFQDETFTRAFLSCHDHSNPVTMIIGAGGSGKSVIYRMIADYYGSKALCLAPTGVAAHNLEVSNNIASTIHSSLGLPVKPYYEEHEIFGKTISALSSRKLLLIDEVSMISSNLMDTILRHVEIVNTQRRSADARIHTILFGDPMQLGPVFQRDKLEPILEEDPGLEGRWEFFNSRRLQMLNPDIYVLKTVFRQSDGHFKQVLDNVRLGKPTDDDIRFLNSMVGPQKEGVLICPTNPQVDEENQKHIDLLARYEVPYVYDAEYLYGSGIRDCGFNDRVEVYIGSRVMCTRNGYDTYGNPVFQNGTIGEVVSYEADDDGTPLPVVKTDDGRVFTVPRMEFTEGAYRRNPETGKREYVTIASAMQIPIRLCYAMTYHKCQGLTLPSAHLVLAGNPQPGLLYMGLSRVRDPNGLTLSGKVSKDMFRTSRSAKKFLEESEGISH